MTNLQNPIRASRSARTQTECGKRRSGARTPQTPTFNVLKEDLESLVINEPHKVQVRRSQPLIPPSLFPNDDSSSSGEEVTLNVAPKMLLPPNTMEVVIGGRRAEIERSAL